MSTNVKALLWVTSLLAMASSVNLVSAAPGERLRLLPYRRRSSSSRERCRLGLQSMPPRIELARPDPCRGERPPHTRPLSAGAREGCASRYYSAA